MRRQGGVHEATLDGVPVDAHAIRLVDDGRTHEIEATLGAPVTAAAR